MIYILYMAWLADMQCIVQADWQPVVSVAMVLMSLSLKLESEISEHQQSDR